jgi:glycosyltransferase involved in cell wall biosynthesis
MASYTTALNIGAYQDTASKPLRILATLIRRPDGPSMGGAADAARLLSVEIARTTTIDFVEMAETEYDEAWGNNRYYFRRGYHGIPSIARRLFPILSQRIFNAFMFSTIPDLIHQGNYNLVHIYNLHPIWAAVQIAYACKRRQVPYVLACHGLHETAERASLMGLRGPAVWAAHIGNTMPLQYLVRNSTLIFASTPADFPVLQKLGAVEKQIKVVPNGVDASYFDPVTEEQSKTIALKYGLPTDKPLLLFVGHLRPKKGVDTLINALAKVPSDWHLAVVGPHTFPELADSLIKLTNQLGMSKKVTFTGEVPLTDLPGLHQLADIFVFPSRSETLPLAILEAMSKRKPVIASNVGGIPFQIDNGAGILVQPDDIDGFAQAISELLVQPEKRRAMGEMGYQRLIDQFTWENAALKAIEGYHAVERG